MAQLSERLLLIDLDDDFVATMVSTVAEIEAGDGDPDGDDFRAQPEPDQAWDESDFEDDMPTEESGELR